MMPPAPWSIPWVGPANTSLPVPVFFPTLCSRLPCLAHSPLSPPRTFLPAQPPALFTKKLSLLFLVVQAPLVSI